MVGFKGSEKCPRTETVEERAPGMVLQFTEAEGNIEPAPGRKTSFAVRQRMDEVPCRLNRLSVDRHWHVSIRKPVL
jgi:hypothetical protein